MASAIEIYSKKKGEANRPSESERVLLGHYKRLGPKSQDSRVYLGAKRLRRGKRVNRNFRIKSLLSQNWGAYVYTKIWKEERENLKASR